jgi:hypothetical protein
MSASFAEHPVLHSFSALRDISRHPTRQQEANRSKDLSRLGRQQISPMKVSHSARISSNFCER